MRFPHDAGKFPSILVNIICSSVRLSNSHHDAGNSPLIYLREAHLPPIAICSMFDNSHHDPGTSPSNIVPLRLISIIGDSIIIFAGIVPTG